MLILCSLQIRRYRPILGLRQCRSMIGTNKSEVDGLHHFKWEYDRLGSAALNELVVSLRHINQTAILGVIRAQGC